MADTKQKSIFDFINDMTLNKVRWEDQIEADQKRFQPYMLNRWLSMHRDYLEIVAECQPVTSILSPREFYRFYSDLLPAKKYFAKYVKSSGTDDTHDNLVVFISDKLKVSKKESLEMIDLILLKPDGIETIKEFIREYGYTDKEIKKQFQI